MNNHGTQSETEERSLLGELKLSPIDLLSKTTSRTAQRSEGHKRLESFRVTVYNNERDREECQAPPKDGIEKRDTQNLASGRVIRVGRPIGATSTSNSST